MSVPRRLFASIHDVSPRFESEIDRLRDLLQHHVGDRLALLVVPNHWQQSPIVAGSGFATRLRHWAEGGFEVFLHGFYHRDGSTHADATDRLRARFMTAGEGEFLGLDRAEAAARIRSGTSLLEDITGRRLAGFVAPAWLYGRGTLEALAECDIPIAEDHLHVWSPTTGEQLSRSPVITWASRSAARRTTSMVAARALRGLPFSDLRVGVHPGDCSSPRILESIERTFRIVARSRCASAYADFRTDQWRRDFQYSSAARASSGLAK
jgi:predicted deacetylase